MPTSTPQARQTWLKVYHQLGSVSQAARRCGIARSTLHRWLKRQGTPDLTDHSRRPHRLAGQTTPEEVVGLVLHIRERFHLGKLRICSHLLQHPSLRLSPSTIARILPRHECQLLKQYRKQQPVVRYARPVPGDRLQLDVCGPPRGKIAPGLYQYTAIDDCSRFKIVCLYKRKTAANSLDFLEQVLEQFVYPVQRIQTDRVRELFAYAFQERLMEYHIKFRPIKPRSPHLNGKVERSHQTDLQEFYRTADLKDPCLNDRLQEWQLFYTYQRPHSALGGKTPAQAAAEKSAQTPFWDEVIARYDPSKERLREQSHYWDTKLAAKSKKKKS